MKIFKITFLIMALLFVSCRTVYYKTMEEFGIEKRDILIDNIKDAKESQEDAKEQFQSALEKFQSVVNFEGGNLEKNYNKLNSEFEDSKGKADNVKKRIKDVETVAQDLFDEWEKELDEYHNDQLRGKSESKLRQTRNLYSNLISTMKAAEKRIDPVLNNFSDQVLYLKHNLNAKAIAAISGELESVQTDISTLIKELERSISEADKFIKNLEEE